ncbi:quinone-dependent dihydroorotate dehydrogenase [Williamsia sterculiae]|uniref:Dihydroorotate dehydrogenase (quinone) n=1 Tax=Williamsia sterculiae TaxID=1344003 RepID=A0A1N7ELP8_9NOCA|nr:quinone-dependent dihydroorotate dehydrogenase [Williamsia sterculiae]SIR88969.1 dihydroorotate oxidase A [Williamsia sterculiae]
MIDRLSTAVYPWLLRLMFLLPPERIHTVAAAVIAGVGRLAPLRRLGTHLLGTHDPILRSRVFGIDFPAPLGLAAGFDKNATAVDAWGALGFGYAELGTVTGRAQPGNPAPRMFRLPGDRAIVNRMGFNNDGADAVVTRLRAQRPVGSVPIGINIGKTKLVEPADAVDDYLYSARLLAPHADYLVVNVSSPNTPGLRDLQAVSSLRPLLGAVVAEVRIPVLVKIAPDLADDDIDAVADLAVELGLAGIVCTNTTIARDGLRTPASEVSAMGAGGLSGAPLNERSLQVLRRVYGRVGDRLTIVSVGGIETADQAWERIRAGASLIQGYTGFIYGGPLWASEIHRGIAERLRAGGFGSLGDAVGSGADTERRDPGGCAAPG